MTLEIILRYLHFVCIFLIVATLASEHLLLKKEMNRAEISRLARIDMVYGLAAITLLSVGLILWLGSVGKPSVFYSKNWVFLQRLHSSLSSVCYPFIQLFSLSGIEERRMGRLRCPP